jgi:altronate hydrolase
MGELIACGSHLTLFTTGRGSVVGSAISPVIKICANPETYRRMSEDMDIDAGRILEGRATLEEVGTEIYERVSTSRWREDGQRRSRPRGVLARV